MLLSRYAHPLMEVEGSVLSSEQISRRPPIVVVLLRSSLSVTECTLSALFVETTRKPSGPICASPGSTFRLNPPLVTRASCNAHVGDHVSVDPTPTTRRMPFFAGIDASRMSPIIVELL